MFLSLIWHVHIRSCHIPVFLGDIFPIIDSGYAVHRVPALSGVSSLVYGPCGPERVGGQGFGDFSPKDGFWSKQVQRETGKKNLPLLGGVVATGLEPVTPSM